MNKIINKEHFFGKMFFVNDFVHYLISLLELLRNCYQNVIHAKIRLF